MRCINILVSARAASCLQPGLAALPDSSRYRLVEFEHADDPSLLGIDAALVSRDITGSSTKYVLDDFTARYYDALRKAHGLQWVHIHSAGLDRPIFGELQARGVEVTPSSGVNAQSVAHTVVAGVLALNRRFPQIMRQQAQHTWRSLAASTLPADLAGQTAVIVGWGPIGRLIGEFLAALGLRIVVARHSPQPVPQAMATVTYRDLAGVLPQADWLILACPLTAATKRLIGPDLLDALPAGASLVNVSRGEVVVEQALVGALRSGRLAGAFLDVFEQEPLPPDSPLWDMENVIVSPHSAGHADGNYQRVIDLFLEKLKDRK
ncbi:D-2-hydroxyacid dehydrogenase [Pollutimonas sp. H1-120]|uniref:D-2-hydroxyacid dehydrogenase n=1 Tax=Pollutimonas sp. H1-120 TaxID=3148824 RepID=UPI003B525A1D